MIKLRADGNVLTCVRAEPVVQGQIDTVIAEVELSTAWDGYSVLIVWSAGGVERSVSLTDGRCVVPWEVLARATVLTAAVTGTLGSAVLSTQFAAVTQILPGPSAVQMSGSPALSPHAQLVQSAIAAERSAQEAALRAETTAAEVIGAAESIRDLPPKLEQLSALKEAIALAAKDAQDSAAMTSVAAGLLEQYGIISGIEAIAVPVQWYTGVDVLANKFFVERSPAAVALISIDEESAPEESAPDEGGSPDEGSIPSEGDEEGGIPSEGGEEGGIPGEGGEEGGERPTEPGGPGLIIVIEYAGYAAGWVSGTEFYLEKTASGSFANKHTAAGRWVVLDYATSRYYLCVDGTIGDEVITMDNLAVINPAPGKLYATADGTYWIWTGTEYIVADLSTLVGGGQSLLERLIALELQLKSIVDALEEVV